MTNIFSSRPRTFDSPLLSSQEDLYGFGDWLSQKRKMNFYAPEVDNTDKNINPPFTNDAADLDQIMKRGATDLDMLRHHIESMPTREQYGLSTKDRILAALLSAGGALASGNVGTGIKIGRDITEAPYQRAMEQYKAKASGLEDVASISDRQIGQVAKVEGIRGSREDRTLRLREMIDARQQRHEEFKQRETDRAKIAEDANQTRKDIAEMNAELRREIRAAGGNDSTERIADPDNPGQAIVVSKNDLMKGKVRKLADAPLGAGEAGIVDASFAVKKAVDSLGSLLPKVKNKLGPISGRWEEWLTNLGASKDPDVTLFARKLHALELSHAKIYGRSSFMMMKMLRDAFGTMGQNPEGVNSALQTMKDQADEFISARTPGRGGNDDNDENIPEYDSNGNLVKKK